MGLVEVFRWINAGRGFAIVLKWIGIGRLLSWILGVRTGVVSASGFAFYPHREAMNTLRSLGESIQGASTVKMILVGGSKLIEEQTNVGNVKKVILPHPDSPNLSIYAKSVKDKEALPGKIRSTTKELQRRGIDVKWRKDMINHTFLIADPESASGWVQWESVLPYCPLPERPCVIVHRPRFDRLVKSVNDSFDKMFAAGATPP